MHRKIFLIGIVGLFCHTAIGQINIPKFGEGMLKIVGQDSTWSLNLAPRVQFLGSSGWYYQNDKFGKPVQDLIIRRARLKLEGFAYSPKFRYKLQFGFSDNDMAEESHFTDNEAKLLVDAVVMWDFHENFELWLGQAKLPGNRGKMISSSSLQFVDRSIVHSKFGFDRDIGIQLRHHFDVSENFVIREMLAISQGEGENVISGNLGGHKYTARVEVLPFGNFTEKGDYIGGDIYREDKPKLSIGAMYDINIDAVKNQSNKGDYMDNNVGLHETNISTYFLDAIFKYRGFSLMGEFTYREADDPIARNSDGSLTGNEVYTGKGLNLQGGYVFRSNWEIAGRFSHLVPTTRSVSNAVHNQFTLGGSKYIVGHNLKIQTDLSYTTADDKSDSLEYRISLAVAF